MSDEQSPGAEYDPFLRGPFPVGVRTLEAHDEARRRVFPIEVWYPAAARHARQDLAAETQDCFTLRQSGAQKKQAAVRDAEARAGKFPLIAYSHHSGGYRRVATFLCTHLASHGYLVAALDHSESIAPELARPRDETEEQKNARWQAVIESRVPDLEFLLDHMRNNGRDWNSPAQPDETKIGIVGHSFGAWTALAAPEVDERIQAVVALAPGGTSNPRPGVLPVKLDFNWKRAVPTLYLVAENDVPLPLDGMRELFARAPEPKQMVILRRADHMHFLDDVEEQHEAFRTMKNPLLPPVAQMQREMRPIAELTSGDQAQLWVRGLTLAHMDSVLKQSQKAQEFLACDIEGELAERGVEVILHRHSPRAIAG